MKPKLMKGAFVFCSVSKKKFSQLKVCPLLVFEESEGTTLILKKEEADKNKLKYTSVWCCIKLQVNSDLSAIGFLAKITEKLSKNQISVNAVSAFFHDYIFVPQNKAKKTVRLLKQITKL